MARFWVVGGEYTDTSFETFAPGKQQQVMGPYSSYQEAHDAWSTVARATIDDATVRYRIIEGSPPA